MPEEPRRRGRPRRAEPAEPAGYRITAVQRRQLYIAMGFTDQRSLQAIIDTAVNDYLRRLRMSVPAYAAAVAGAEHHLDRPTEPDELDSSDR
jgi:hypothetical protein